MAAVQPAAARHALASLRHRDFRLLWLGQLISTVGDQMQLIGISWHLYVLTNSPIQLGLLGVVRAVPFMGLSLAGGAIADAFERKRLLIVTQVSQMAVTTALVVTTATGHEAVWQLYAVTFISGAAQAFDAPARQAMIPNLVPRREMAGALTLMTIMRRTSMIVGPGIAGLIIGRFGVAPAYLGNAISFLAVVVAVLLMGPAPKVALAPGNNWDRILGGMRFARREPLVLMPMLMDFLTRGVCNNGTLLPIFARDVFHAGVQGYGWLSTAASVGAVAGGLVLGGSRPVKHPIALMLCAYTLEGLLLAALGLSPVLAVAWIVLFARGITNVAGEILRVTVLQLKTPDEIRGRVTALSGMFDSGGPQTGQISAGVMASYIGPVGATLTGGFAATTLTLLFFLATGLRGSLGLRSEQLAEAPST